MSQEPTDELAEHFRNGLENLELKVSPALWGAIEAKLEAPKKKAVFWWWKGAVAAGLGLGLGLGIFYGLTSPTLAPAIALSPNEPAPIESPLTPFQESPSDSCKRASNTSNTVDLALSVPKIQFGGKAPNSALNVRNNNRKSSVVSLIIQQGTTLTPPIADQTVDAVSIPSDNSDLTPTLKDENHLTFAPDLSASDSVIKPEIHLPPSVLVVQHPSASTDEPETLEQDQLAENASLGKWAVAAYYQSFGGTPEYSAQADAPEVALNDDAASSNEGAFESAPIYRDVVVYEVRAVIASSSTIDSIGGTSVLGGGYSIISVNQPGDEETSLMNANTTNSNNGTVGWTVVDVSTIIHDSIAVDTIQVIDGYTLVPHSSVNSNRSEGVSEYISDVWTARDTAFQMPISFAAKISYRPNRRLAIETGIDYTIHKAEVQWINDYRAQTNTESISTHLLGIPLSVRFDYVLRSRFQLYAITESSLATGLKSQRDFDLDQRVQVRDRVDGIQYRASLGQGVNVPVMKQISAYAEGRINRVGATKTVGNLTSSRQDSWWPSVQTGIRWTFR